MAIKTTYNNRLPHITPIGGTFFVTFRLADALPAAIATALKMEYKKAIQPILLKKENDYKEKIKALRKIYFKNFEHQLDKKYGSCILENKEIAQILKEKLLELDGNLYELIAFCIMPNHVHILIDLSLQLADENGLFFDEIPESYKQLDKIMQKIKGASARKINLFLGKLGTLWMKDSFDHYIRNDDEYRNVINYILNNPIQAGLVKNQEDWAFSYCKGDIRI